MPYVQRNWKGEITGLFANAQPSYAEEELPDDHPDIVTFREAHPIPPETLREPSPDEIRELLNDSRRVEREHEELRKAIWAFNRAFYEFEIALSALLYVALNRPKSKVAYAIYYSPALPFFVSPAEKASGYVVVCIPAGWVGERHPSPHRQIAFCLSGSLKVTASDGDVRVIKAGDAWLMTDTHGKGHESEVASDTSWDAVIILVENSI